LKSGEFVNSKNKIEYKNLTRAILKFAQLSERRGACELSI